MTTIDTIKTKNTTRATNKSTNRATITRITRTTITISNIIINNWEYYCYWDYLVFGLVNAIRTSSTISE